MGKTQKKPAGPRHVDVPLAKIERNGGTQSRVGINQKAVEDYAEEMRAGVEFPAPVVYQEGEKYWLADGFHRVAAALAIGAKKIRVEIRQGGRFEALLFAVGANRCHGLRRTNEDKRNAVRLLIGRPECADWSSRKIADACGVSHLLVNEIRNPEAREKRLEKTRPLASDASQVLGDREPRETTATRIVPEHFEEHDEPEYQVDDDAPADEPGGEYPAAFREAVEAARAAGEPISTNPAKVEEPGEGLEDGILFDVLRGCEASANALKVAVSRWRSWVEAVTAYYKAHPEHEARLPIAEMNEIDRHLGARGATTIEHLAYRVSELAPEEVCPKCGGAGLDPEGVKCCRGRGWISHGEAQERRRIAERAA